MDEMTVGIAALVRTRLFAGLDRDDLQQVLGCRQRVSFGRGQVMVKRWDPGDAMYIIVSGAAEVDVGGRFHRLERGDRQGEGGGGDAEEPGGAPARGAGSPRRLGRSDLVIV
jgi:CRP-like cAMP-binding protein